MMEFKIQDLVIHCMIEELCFLWDLYGESNNIIMAYDVVQELFRKKHNGWPMDDYYGDFNRLVEKLQL